VVVGQTTLQPGQSTTLYLDFMMHAGMDGKHLFEVLVQTNDPAQGTQKLLVASDWGE
jgi:hypothetical protein